MAANRDAVVGRVWVAVLSAWFVNGSSRPAVLSSFSPESRFERRGFGASSLSGVVGSVLRDRFFACVVFVSEGRCSCAGLSGSGASTFAAPRFVLDRENEKPSSTSSYAFLPFLVVAPFTLAAPPVVIVLLSLVSGLTFFAGGAAESSWSSSKCLALRRRDGAVVVLCAARFIGMSSSGERVRIEVMDPSPVCVSKELREPESASLYRRSDRVRDRCASASACRRCSCNGGNVKYEYWSH